MRSYKTFAAIVAAATILVGSAGMAAAQEMEMPQLETPTAEDFSEEQVSLFAEAYIEIQQIGMAYQEPIQAAESEDARRALMQEANDEMIVAIEGKENFSVDDYNGIAAAAQADEEFAAEIQTEINNLAVPQ